MTDQPVTTDETAPFEAGPGDRADPVVQGAPDEIDQLDDGGTALGIVASDPRSEALPFVLTAREHFASAGDVEATGEARVDAATARLAEIPDLPTSDHVAVYDDVHRRLQDALSDAEVR